MASQIREEVPVCVCVYVANMEWPFYLENWFVNLITSFATAQIKMLTLPGMCFYTLKHILRNCKLFPLYLANDLFSEPIWFYFPAYTFSSWSWQNCVLSVLSNWTLREYYYSKPVTNTSHLTVFYFVVRKEFWSILKEK